MNGAGHPSDTIAALLTAGELSQRSGRDLITATVLAYEVYCIGSPEGLTAEMARALSEPSKGNDAGGDSPSSLASYR